MTPTKQLSGGEKQSVRHPEDVRMRRFLIPDRRGNYTMLDLENPWFARGGRKNKAPTISTGSDDPHGVVAAILKKNTSFRFGLDESGIFVFDAKVSGKALTVSAGLGKSTSPVRIRIEKTKVLSKPVLCQINIHSRGLYNTSNS